MRVRWLVVLAGVCWLSMWAMAVLAAPADMVVALGVSAVGCLILETLRD